MSQQAHATSANPLSNPGFFRLLTFRVCIVLSYQIMAVVVGWHIYQITHDTLALGLIGLAELIPYFGTALFAGYAVDHYSRRLFGVFAAVVLTINSLILAGLSSGLSNESSLWIYVSIAFVGLARAFIGPTYSAMFAILLRREQYAKAASVGSVVFQFGLIIGPALGGILIAIAGIVAAYLAAAMFAAVSAIAILTLKGGAKPAAESAPIFTSIAEGVRYVYNHQIILAAQSLDMFAVLFGGAVAMLPVFIHDVFHYGPEGLGILRASPALGAVVTGIILARHPITQHAGRWLLIAVAGFGVSIIAFALTPYFWLASFLLVLSGVCDGISVVLRTTIMQLMTPDHMRGRVASINGLFIGSSNELGAFESGLAARVMGLIPSVIFGGTMTIAVVLATAKLAPKLRQLNLKDWH